MIGFAVALAAELITEKGVFFSMTGDSAALYGTAAFGVFGLAAALAVARNQVAGDGLALLEPVYASLTAVRRSAASVTQAQVDRAVDVILEEVDGVATLSTVLEDEFI